jgi:acyl transferase domain-containing protein/thioesterase domain-containing protein
MWSPLFKQARIELITAERPPNAKKKLGKTIADHSDYGKVSMTDQLSNNRLDEVAIIGMVCRFPGAKDIHQFWRNLKEGVDSISFFTNEELLASGVPAGRIKHPDYVKARGILDGIEMFDPSFFGMTPREAQIIDPQQRLFLESAAQALESAGYNPDTYSGAIGVYAGTGMSEYLFYIHANPELRKMGGGFNTMLGNDKDYLTTRVSYKLNLKGPSINVNTACSTSLVAIAIACQSLLNAECDIALAGGVSIFFPQKVGHFHQEGAINSPDGHCRPFDAKAEGTVGGNGVGIVVLKRLGDALNDGDYIHAVIKGSAVNNDGSSKVGYTAPSIDGQAKVIGEALAMANVEADSISYVETHGTATPLGDPIEIAALTKVFRATTARQQFCAVGSVKSNIGHLDAAAGVAGLIKTALALQHQLIPASLHYEQANPKIDFAHSPFFVNARARPWVASGGPRRAGVSSFGIGGTNAHLVLEEAPARRVSGPSRTSQLLVLSAKTAVALEQVSENLAQYLRQNATVNLADVAHTYAVGRRAFAHRRIVLCAEVSEALQSLASGERQAGAGRVWSGAPEPKYRPVHFLFSGQASQNINMGRQLYESQQVYRETVDRCAAVVAGVTGVDVRRVLYPEAGGETAAREQLKQTGVTQPALFITEYALVKLWAHWGVKPQGMLGHSLGEYVAACVAGVLSEEDALRLVAVRGALMQQLPAGAMLAVGMSEGDVRAVAGERVSVAAINGAELTVLSGEADALAEVERELSEQTIWTQWLETSHAFHSQMMDPMMEEYRAAVEQVELREPQQAYVSSVTGEWVNAAQVREVDYWVAQVREPVRFWAGLQTLQRGGESVVVEVGPGKALSVLARAVWGPEAVVVSTLGVTSEQQSEEQRVSAAVGQLWLGGVEIDWSKYYSQERRARVALPTYPFERKRYWAETRTNGSKAPKDKFSSSQSDLANWFYIPSWKQSLSPALVKHGEMGDQKLRWLVFDDKRLGLHLVQRLKQEEQDVTIVRIGEQFEISELGDQITISHTQADYDALVRNLNERDKIPHRIVHLWNVTSQEQGQTESDIFADAQRTGFYSLLFLAQALKEQQIVAPVQLSLVSNSIQEVVGDEILRPAKATALAVCRIIKQEYPGLTCRNIDLSESELDVGQDEDQLVSQLLAELVTDSSDPVVAYRRHQRWVQSLQPVTVEGDNKRRAGLREGGVYVIICELESAGLKLAAYLALTVKAKLALVLPPSIPKVEDWEQWLATHPHENSVGRLLLEARAIQNSGADILFTHAEMGQPEAMREVLDKTYKHFAALHGVIHAPCLLKETSGEDVREAFEEKYERQLNVKRQELSVLEEVLRERQMDFCLLLSSLAIVVGGSESVLDAANAQLLSTFARKVQHSTLTPWIILNWEMSVAGEQEEGRSSAFTIALEDALEAFRRVLCLGQPLQVFVSPVDFKDSIQEENTPAVAVAADLAPSQDSGLHARPNLRNEYVPPRNNQEQIIADVWKDLLGIKQLGVLDNFFEMGGHSLLAIQVMRRLSGILKLKLTPDKLIEVPTVAGLAESIAKSRRNGQARSSPAIPMQAGGSKRPFFCVHPIGGGIFCFRDLVRHLGPDQPFYGLQARELSEISGEGDPFNTLEDMAAYYVKAVRAVQPAGPYLIGGFSWGSIVAFEMAQQLNRANEKVALLVIMDTPTPDVVGKIADFDDTTLLLIIARDLGHQRGMQLPITFQKLQELKSDEKFDYVLRELRKANILTADVSQTWLQHHLRGYRARMSAAQNYAATPYSGTVTLFRASETDAEVEEHFDEAMREELRDPTFGWAKLSTSPVELHDIPGNHSVILLEPSVRILAQRLTESIKRTETEKE